MSTLVIRYHPFVDGNKRTAITAVGLFLRLSGFSLQAANDEMARFTLVCPQLKVALDAVKDWLRRCSDFLWQNSFL